MNDSLQKRKKKKASIVRIAWNKREVEFFFAGRDINSRRKILDLRERDLLKTSKPSVDESDLLHAMEAIPRTVFPMAGYVKGCFLPRVCVTRVHHNVS